MRYEILDVLRDIGEEHLKEKAKLWSWTDLGRLWFYDLQSCDLWAVLCGRSLDTSKHLMCFECQLPWVIGIDDDTSLSCFVT